MEFDSLSNQIIKAALRVHTALGPGLFEQVYKACLLHEIRKAGLECLSEVGIPVNYDGVPLDIGYRADLLVEDTLIVELKSVQNLAPLHSAQLLTYLKLARKDIGRICNSNCVNS